MRAVLRRIVQGRRPARATGPRRARVVAVATQKGGVGKTTTAVNLASALARFHGLRVLLVDLDPQGHVHQALGHLVRPGGGALSEILAGDVQAELMDVATSTLVENLDVTPIDPHLAVAEGRLGARIGKELVLREAMEATRTWYDVVLLDCPPHLGPLTVNALVAADQVLVPCDPSPLAVSGVHALVEAVAEIARRLNPEVDLLGVLLTRVDGRNVRLNRAVEEELAAAYGDVLLPVRIGVSTDLARAQQAGRDVFDFAPESRGAAHYRALAALVAERLGYAPSAEAETSAETAQGKSMPV